MKFSEYLQKRCMEAGDKAETIARKTADRLLNSMINKSPVGNPDVWKANQQAQYMRETHNMWVDVINADLGKGDKKVKRIAQKKLREAFPNVAGEHYTGGRFRSNWQVGIGSMNEATNASPGDDAAKRGAVAIEAFKAGQTIWITNNLAYAKRLEYGWSKQAPGGMVRLALQDFSRIVDEETKKAK